MFRPGGQNARDRGRRNSDFQGAKRSNKSRGRNGSRCSRHAGTRMAGGAQSNMGSATNFPNAAEGNGNGTKDKKKRDYGDRQFKSPFRVHVGNLPCSGTNMVTLSQYFASVKPNSIAIATSTGSPYECVGYAFLGFPTSARMVNCRDLFHGGEFMGREISVKLMGENIFIDDPMQREGSGAKAEAPGEIIAEKVERPKEAERPQTVDAAPQIPEDVLHPGQAGELNSEEAQNANATPLVAGGEFHPSQAQEGKPEQEAAPKADTTIPVEEDGLYPPHAEEKPVGETQVAEDGTPPGHDGGEEQAKKEGKKARKSKKTKKLKSKITASVKGEPNSSRAEGEEKPEWERAQNAEAALQVAEDGFSPSQAGEETPAGESAKKAEVAAASAVEDFRPSQAGEGREEGKKPKKPNNPKEDERAKKRRKLKTAAPATEGGSSTSRVESEEKPEGEQAGEEASDPKTSAVAQGPRPLPGQTEKQKRKEQARAEKALALGKLAEPSLPPHWTEDEKNPSGDQSAKKAGAVTQVGNGLPHHNSAGAQDGPKETRAVEAKAAAAESGGFLLRASRPGDGKPAKNSKLKAQVTKDGGFPSPVRAEKSKEDESVKKAMLAAQTMLGLGPARARTQEGKTRVKRKAGEEASEYTGKMGILGKRRGRGEETGQGGGSQVMGVKGVPSKKHRR